jgi:hypothetical protein
VCVVRGGGVKLGLHIFFAVVSCVWSVFVWVVHVSGVAWVGGRGGACHVGCRRWLVMASAAVVGVSIVLLSSVPEFGAADFAHRFSKVLTGGGPNIGSCGAVAAVLVSKSLPTLLSGC